MSADILNTLAVVFTALGGWEALKWLFNKRNHSKIIAAQADQAEAKADTDEFHLLKEQFLFLQEQLNEKEKRFAEQTDVVRRLNTEAIASEKKIGELQLELALKRCEVKKCLQRQPQNGY